jgi:hypothetical protein
MLLLIVKGSIGCWRKRYSFPKRTAFWLFMKKGKQYEVIGQFDQQDRSKPLDLTSMYVKTAKAI